MIESVKIERTKLLAQLEANRDRHRETFEKATEAFVATVNETAIRLGEDARAGREVDRLALYKLPVPEDHTEDYDLAIDMLANDTRKTITIEYRDFLQLWRDQWGWKQQWTTTNTFYGASG